MKLNVLITSASRKMTLLAAFRAAVRSYGGVVVAADASPRSAALLSADFGSVVPRGLGEPFAAAVDVLCRRHQIGLIVPTRDEELPFFAAHRERWAPFGVVVTVAPTEVIEVCQDKIRFVRFCQAHGFAVPETYSPAEARSAGFPLFIRPRLGKGGRGAVAVHDATDLEYALRVTPDPLIQRLIEAPEYTIDLFADFSGRVLSAVPRIRLSVVAGESYISETRRDEGLIEEAVRLATSLGLVGPNTLQCFLVGERPVWIEVNPRYGGAMNLGIHAGADTTRMLVRLARGEDVEPVLGQFQDRLVMLRYAQDLFIPADRFGEVPRVD